jgi:polyphosphate kinase
MATQTNTVKKVEEAIKELKESKEPKESKELKEPKEPKESKEKKKPKKLEDKAVKEPPRTPPSPLVTIVGETAAGEIDLDSPEYFLNRELTWLNYCRRVLHEAEDERTPLLERVKFLAIVSSNLDEFFMKRIGGLKQQVGAGLYQLTVDGRTPQQQIFECHEMIRALEKRRHKVLSQLIRLLREHGIVLARFQDLKPKKQAFLREYYLENIYPLVTPQAMDPAHPFPFVSNLSLNLLVTLNYPDAPNATPSLARVKVPIGAGIPRLLRVENENTFVPLEDVMAHNLDLLFPGMKIESCELFRVTRNANTELDEEKADDLLAMIETELRERKFAPIVKLEVAKDMASSHRDRLASEFGLDEEADVFEVEGMLGKLDLMELATLDFPELHDPPHHPIDHPEMTTDRTIFHIIRDVGSILLHHPYESFSSSVERLVREASQDPKVRAIKVTLYRTAAESRIIQHLIEAAKNGKQVLVVVELKARFDEEANIRWANHLEEAGIHVTYGVVGLKTHCKLILVVRQDYDGLKRYAHLGTGNYHEETARTYSDLGLLTSDSETGQDLTELFNYLTTGYKPKRQYHKILPSPKILKGAILQKIEREIGLHSSDSSGLIQMKMNALEDADITRALYRASQAGVKVDLIVRDTCRLRPGIPGLTDNVQVLSIIDRFLEHTRIYYFRNGGDEEYYLGSADLMKRNLESRVEAVFPVEAPPLKKKLRFLLDTQLNDRRSAWDMQSDGSYIQRQPKSEKEVGTQQTLIDWSEKQYKEATRLRKRKTQGIGRRQGTGRRNIG